MDTYLTFVLGDEVFAVAVTKILEVLQKQYITKIPRTPGHILGIINFRGNILPVIDTRTKFGMPDAPANEKQIVIVFETGITEKFTMAAVADSVKDVIEINKEEIKQVPELGLNYDVDYITGVVNRKDTFILLLDIDKIFSVKDLSSIQMITTEMDVIE